MAAPFRSLLKGLAGNLVGRASSQVEPYVQFFKNVTSSLGDDFGCDDDLAVHCFASSRWVPGLSQVIPPQDVPILMQISLASDNAFGCPSSAVSDRNDLETSFQVQRTSRSRLVVSRGLSFLAPQMGHVDVILSGCSCGGRVGGSVACFCGGGFCGDVGGGFGIAAGCGGSGLDGTVVVSASVLVTGMGSAFLRLFPGAFDAKSERSPNGGSAFVFSYPGGTS